MRVDTQPRGGSSQGGTGTVIWSDAGRCGVLTCAHVTHGRRGELLTITWRDGRTARGRLESLDQAADWALVLVDPAPAELVVLAAAKTEHMPRAGAAVHVAGYGNRGRSLTVWPARVRGYAPLEDARGRSLGHWDLSVDTNTISGDSGGPVIYGGRLVAVLRGGPLAGPGGPMICAEGVASHYFLSQCRLGVCPPSFFGGPPLPRRAGPSSDRRPPTGTIAAGDPAPTAAELADLRARLDRLATRERVDLDPLRAELADLRARLDRLPTSGPAELDLDRLARQVADRLPGRPFEIHNPDGSILRTSKPLGEPIKIGVRFETPQPAPGRTPRPQSEGN